MAFAKHETFYIRDGWLYKGLSAVSKNPGIFLDDAAPEMLGLGKNMVRSLRFWMQSSGLSEERRSEGRMVQFLTAFGQYVLEFDPYQELDGTIWLLHYHLISNNTLTTTWYWFFNHFVPTQFSLQDYLTRLRSWTNIQSDEDTKQVADSSLRKDFDCLIKTYLSNDQVISPEDVLESPLTILKLLSSHVDVDDETKKKVRVYRLESGVLDNIHPLVMLYVLLQAQEIYRQEAHQVNLQVVMREPCNVGRTFNIKPTDLEDMFSRLNDKYPDCRVQLTRTGGLDQITLPSVPAQEVMKMYFQERVDAAEEVQTWSRPLIR